MKTKELPNIEHLNFRPFPGLASPHLQTFFGTFSWRGKAPHSVQHFIPLQDGDSLCCEISTPSSWEAHQKTLLLVHGLGGSHASSYMVRLSRQFYEKGYRVVRVNLRGSGSGKHHAQFPYHGGVSQDLLKVIHILKDKSPDSDIILLGFSLGGNIALKLTAELETDPGSLLKHIIAVCPPIDLSGTINLLCSRSNRLYHNYYLKLLKPTAKKWGADSKKIFSMYDFDNQVTAPIWGFKNAEDYYRQSSSCYLLPKIQRNCQILFAKDDPFIDYRSILKEPLPPSVRVFFSEYGGHLGFIGQTEQKRSYFWLDQLLQKWVEQIN